MKGVLLVLVLLSIALVACGEKEKGAEPNGPCTPAPSPIPQASLPTTFPTPVAATYTAGVKEGPTLKVSAFVFKDLADVYDGYKTAFATGGYSVTKSEKEADDAEVVFAGNGTTGQVALKEVCPGATTITITIRPS